MARTPPSPSRRELLAGAVALLALPTLAWSAPAERLTPFSLLDFGGERVDVGEWIGEEVIMIVFWATWCSCCLEELPRLEALRQEYEGRGFRLVAINIDPPNQQTRAGAQMRRIRFGGTSLVDPEGKVVDVYNRLKKTPTSLIVDRKGVIARRIVGAPPGTDAELRGVIEPLLRR